ncbi:hypothetical protein BJAS_P4239 [Bathymodiolus japonicus methanotrophic gill symbiont]|uniref:hypothetical protein n=1 Tax=Bathymodiolus japonicus methanotrophic gill symbiont TaxID=113269 RepID=UPI001B789BDE|nr:hypothetical protein [Bathymodiolus japonicus methanotrophic gill symbiont]GFO73431.1 hypothetical protein BJAS_P4239 [Bathymodiolus japonicus methanotrophic gill symbiont]
MAFVYDLLLNSKSFKFKFSTPTRSYAEKTLTFPLSGAELIKSPFKPKKITQNTEGAWYGIKEKVGTLVLVEEVKRGSRGLLKMSFIEKDGEFTVEADLSTVDWTASSGYQASYQRCDYLGFSSTEGVISINGHAVTIPLECKYVNHQTSFTGSDGEDVSAVPAIGYLKSQEVKIPLSLAADLFIAKTFKLSLNIEGVPVGEVKTITLKRSAKETFLAIAKKAESKKNNKNKTMSDIKNKLNKQSRLFMFKKITIAAVITAGVGIGVLEYSKAIETEEAPKSAEIVAAQEKYDIFTGKPIPEEIGEGFFSRKKDELTKVRVANIRSRGEVFRIAHDQDGYREVISRKSYAGNTIVQPEARWASGSRYFCESLFWASQPKQAAKT